jgi:membrane-associated HD superfamily phosphohydrolase
MKRITTILETKYPAILWTIIIFIMCTIPSEHILISNSLNDKINHFIAFAGFSFFWLFQQYKTWLIILGAAIYGLAIEFWQAVLPISFHRGFDWYDALADAIGGVIGYFIWLIYKRLII